MNININSERLWESLMEMAQIGPGLKGGCNRQALTDEDKQGRELFGKWCIELGCTIHVDEIGNLFALKQGSQSNLPPIMMGSHLDTQPTGGKFDGVYGVLSAVEVIRTLEEKQITTNHPLEIVVWTNEEGARFSPAMLGSGVWADVFSLDYGLQRQDKNGVLVKEELKRLGYMGQSSKDKFNKKAFIELHIEQGPILEKEGKQIGVVQGVQGIRWYDLTLIGESCHAGPTPMESRKDCMLVMTKIMQALYELVSRKKLGSRITFGDISISPGSRNTLPNKAVLAIDLRNPMQEVLNQLDIELREIIQTISQSYHVDHAIDEIWHSPAVSFNQACIDSVTDSVKKIGYDYQLMHSGAGHDSVYVAKKIPTSMIFIPCKNGLSHNEEESITMSEAEAGANVLLHTILTIDDS